MSAPRPEAPQAFSTPRGMQIAHERPLEGAWRAFQQTRFAGATYPEFLVIHHLEERLHYAMFEDFWFQVPLLNGSFFSDILVLRDQPRPLDIEVMGVAFHGDFAFGSATETRSWDVMKRQALEDNGYGVAWVSDTRVIEATATTVTAALNGQDVL